MAPKKQAVNKKSSALRKSPRKKRTRSPSPEPPPQLDPVDVEDTEIEVDKVASERDSSIARRIVEIVDITAICFSHMPCCLSGCQLSNDDTLRFAGFIYFLAKNRKDS
ncbi:Uncharacterised protein r2_g2171 [Pycnogonum litorale]